MKTNNLENMQLRKHDNTLLKQFEEHATSILDNRLLRQQATLTTSNLYNMSTSNLDNITTSHLENDSKQLRQHYKKNVDNKHL